MKFSTLTSSQRSAIAALVNAGELRTDKLSKCMSMDNSAAATVLCGLRKAGLVYSKDRNGSSYSLWGATLVAETLFAKRPDCSLVYSTSEDQQLLRDAKTYGARTHKHEADASIPTRYVVVPEFVKDPSGTRAQALLAAQHASIETGRVHHVLALVAEVTPPAQPTATVTLL